MEAVISFIAMLAVPIVALTSIVAFAYSGRARDEPRRLEAAHKRAVELQCLAENIYFEARGEPLNGQYAVAEVTINRLRSPYFPKTICGVVHDTRWDPLRRRFVAHFSWTQMEEERALGAALAAVDCRRHGGDQRNLTCRSCPTRSTITRTACNPTGRIRSGASRRSAITFSIDRS